jgi:iron complex transport system substrate-binding protein
MRYALIILALVCACGRSERTGRGSATASGSATEAMRIVTLMPSGTEVVAALGATDELVGVDDYSTFPPEVTKLPKVGSFLQPNQETIVGLHPTFVIVDDIHGSVAGALKDRGLETIECDMHALPDVKAALKRVGARLGRQAQADALVTQIDADLDAAAAAKPAKHPKVLAVIDREAGGLGNLVAAGPGSWLDELIAVVGGDNVLAASGVRYPKISLEEVLRAQPDIIIDVSYAARTETSSWDEVKVPAVTNHAVHSMQDPFLQGPSPRVKAALAALARVIHEPR